MVFGSQGNTVCSGFAFVSAGGIRGGLGLVFLAMGVAAAIAFRGIELRHLRCPNCGRFILPWFSMEETQYCRACGFHFPWKFDRWWEKGN